MLLTAVLAVCAVGTTVQASTGWEGNTFYIGGDQAGHLDNSVVTGFSTGTPEGGVFTTTMETVDVTGKTGTLNLWADYNGATTTNAILGELKVAKDTTLNFGINSWNASRYFDTLTIEQLSVADGGSTSISTADLNHKINIKGLSGSLNNVTVSNGHLTISAATASVGGKLYSNGGNVTLGDGTNAGIITVERVEFSDRNGGDALNLNIESGYTLKVTGSTNDVANNTGQYKTNSFIISEWANSTNMNVRGTVLAENAAVLTGDSGATINIENGATLATKGLGQSNPGKTTTSTINLADGGTLILGDMGLNYNGRATVNVAGGTIGIAAGEVTIAESLNITGAATLETTQYTYGETTVAKGDTAGTVNITKDLTGNGSLTISGNGNVNLGQIESSVSISAGEANIDFGGSLTLGDSASFTAGSGTYTISGDAALFNTAAGGIIVDKDGAAATNGFMQGAYELISGGTITNEFTVSYEGTEYTINNESRAFGDGGTNYNTWYVTQDSSTLSDVYTQSQAGASVNADINLAAGTTLNADTALQSAVEMEGDATLNISEGVSVAATSITTGGNTVTLDGKGTYNISAGNATKVAIAEGWSGTVELFGQSNASLDLSAYGQAGSTISIKEYTGYFANNQNATKTIAANLILTNTNLAAVELTNGYSGCTYAFTGSMKGSGNFLVNKDLNGGKMTFEFSGDVSDWDGQMAIIAGEHNIVFTGDATVINAQLISRSTQQGGKGKANITFDHEQDVTVNSTFTNQANGIHLTVSNTGTTTFTSNQVAMSSLTLTEGTKAAFTGITNLSVTNLTLDADTMLTIGNGTAVVDGSAAPALAVTGTAELTGGATINGGLDLSNATAITLNGMDAAITINGDLTLPGTAISLSGDVLEALSGLTAGQQVALFDVTGTFTLGDMEVSALAAEDGKMLTDVFSAADVEWDDIYLGYDGTTVYAAMMDTTTPDTPVDPTVPEPTTATLSLLALAALAARRRRR